MVGELIALGIFGVFLILSLVVLGILAFVFWIVMIIDCATRKFKDPIEKVVWILVIIFLHILGALIYYFVVKNQKR